MADTSAVFRAIADFSRLRAEARRAKKEMSGLSDATDDADEKLGDAERSANSTGDALEKTARAARAAKRAAKETGDGADDASGKLDKMARSARRAKDALDRLDKSDVGRVLNGIASAAGRAASKLGKIGVGVAGISLLATAATAALGPILSLAGAIAGLSGVVGVLPGILGAAGLAAGAMKLAFSGVEDVMKAIGEEDAEAFEEAIADLPPAMQEAARAARDLKPAFDAMRTSVQQAFWTGLGPLISKLGTTYMPMLTAALTATATAASGLTKEFGNFLLKQSSIESMRGALDNVTSAFAGLKGVGEDVASVFVDLFSVSSEFLPGMADSINEATGEFADFIHEARKTGDLKEWIGAGIEQVKALGSVLGNVGSIFGAVFKAGSDAGAGFLVTLDKITANMAEFLHSAEGQTALRQMFHAIGRAADVITPILKEAVLTIGDLVPIFVSIGERLGPGVQAVIKGIGDAFQTAQPGLNKLAAAFGDFLKAIGGSGPLIGELVNGLANVLTPVLKLLTGIIETLTGAFNALPEPMQNVIGKLGGVVLAAGLALAAFSKLVKVGAGVVGMFKTVSGAAVAMRKKFAGGKAGKAAAGGVAGGGVIAGGGGKGKPGKGGIGGKLGGKGGKIGAVLGLAALVFGVSSYQEANAQGAQTVQAFGQGAAVQGPTTAQKIGTALMGIGPLAALFGPWGWVVAALSVAIGAIMKHWDTIGPWLNTKWNQITTWGKSTWGDFTGWLGRTWESIDAWGKRTWSDFTSWLKGIWQQSSKDGKGIWGNLNQNLSVTWDEITAWGKRTWGDFTSWLSRTWDDVSADTSSTWNDITNWISGAMADAKSAVGSAVSWIGDRLSDIGGWISDTASDITNFASNAASTVGGWFGMSKGGWVGGSGRGDTQPRMLDPREFVVRPKPASEWAPWLEAINSGASPGDLALNAAGLSGITSSLASGLAPLSRRTSTSGATTGPQVGPVHVTQVVHNPAAEKPSVTLQKRVARLASAGLADALEGA